MEPPIGISGGHLPNQPPSDLRRAVTLQRRGRPEDLVVAEEEYRKVIQAEPDNVIARNNLAILLANKGSDFAEASSMAERARVKQPIDPQVLDTVGWILFKKGDSDRAIQAFSQSVALNPYSSAAQYHYAVAIDSRGYKNRALELLKSVLKIRHRPTMNGWGRAESSPGGFAYRQKRNLASIWRLTAIADAQVRRHQRVRDLPAIISTR